MAVDLSGWKAYCRFREPLGALIDPRFYTPAWLDAQVLTGAARVWYSEGACIVATINTFPAGGKEVHGLAAIGELRDVVQLIPAAERWGMANGCAVASISSRGGWSKALAPHGYAPYQVTVRKELSIGVDSESWYTPHSE